MTFIRDEEHVRGVILRVRTEHGVLTAERNGGKPAGNRLNVLQILGFADLIAAEYESEWGAIMSRYGKS